MYKALVSFSGLVTATKGQEIEIKDEYIIKDLKQAGYIEEIKKETLKEVVKEVKKSTKKK